MKKSILGMLCLLAYGAAMAEGDPVAGKTKTLLCSGCHTRDGNSKNPEYPVLAGQGQQYMTKQILDFKSGARKESHMTPIVEAIAVADIPDITAYFTSQKRTPNSAPPPPSDAGKQIFLTGNSAKPVSACQGCHGEDGKGNAVLKFPSLAGQHADYITKMLKEFRSASRNNDKASLMRNIAVDLNDKEIEALAAYITTLQ